MINLDELELDDWAKNELKMMMDRNKKDETENDDWDWGSYTDMCIYSAAKAYASLLVDNHSGMSICLTKAILNSLIDHRPLSPITENDEWKFAYVGKNNSKVYQCARCSSLFKTVFNDGTEEFSDVNRCVCANIDHPDVTFSCGAIEKIYNKTHPITFPYAPPARPVKIVCDDYLLNKDNGDYDHQAVLYFINEDGVKEEINQFMKEKNGKMVAITKEEYFIDRENRL